MKKIVIYSLIVALMLLLPSNRIKAEESYTINGYVITYNGKDYDLSTSQGNYDFTEDNQNISVQEYIDILNNVYTFSSPSNMTTYNGNEYGINELVPGDPGYGGYTYFNSMYWFYRSDDGWNLSLNPKSIIRDNGPSFANAGWTNEVVYYQSGSSHWYNADSLYGQYICHYLFATYKTEWNLAPSIPNKPAFQWIVDRCN